MDVEAAWAALHEANDRLRWYVGRPTYTERREEWSMYAFDPTERVKLGRRTREWTAVAPTEAAVVREMARCLVEIERGTSPA